MTEQPILLCGLGHVGWRVLEYLREAGLRVVAIDNCCTADDPRLGAVQLVRGDFRQADVLRQAGVDRYRGVLILTSDDLVNISTALMVRHLHPDVRIVVRLFNQNLVPRLGKALNNTIALSVSRLTAPLLALTALTGQALGTFTLEGGRRQVAELNIQEQSPLRGQTVAETAGRYRAYVLAHLPRQGTERFLLDVDASARLTIGDRLILCADPRDLTLLLEEIGDEAMPELLWAGKTRRAGRVLWRTLGEVDLAVKLCTGVLFGVVAVSTLVYYFGRMASSPPDALYRTISVIATGADMRAENLPEGWQKVFVSILRITGAALIASFTAILTNYLLRARLKGALEVRRIPDGGHVIVCGLGNLGFRVVEELLQSGERVVVLEQERDSRFVVAARRLGAAVIIGDATVMETLRQAHTATSRAVVAATSNELANLEIALLARDLNPQLRVVVRLLDPGLAQMLRESAHIRYALAVPTLAAPAFVAALFGDRVPTVFLVKERLLAVIEMLVPEQDPHLSGQVVRALAIDYRLLPVYLAAADGTPRPQPLNARLAAGDRLTVIAQMADLQRFLRRERVAADWSVEVTGFTLPARSVVVQLVADLKKLAAADADAALEHLPLCVGSNLTRGQAEDLLVRLRRDGIKASMRQ